MATGAILDLVESIERNDTSFDTRIADTTTNRLDTAATYDFNTTRHKLIVNGSEVRDPSTTTKFTDRAGKWQLNASAGDTIQFASRERVRYVPNYELLVGAVAWYESQPDSDQRLFVEFSDDKRDNAYRYEMTPGSTKAELISGGTVVDTLPESDWGEFGDATDRDHNPYEYISRTVPVTTRSKLNWYGAGNFRPGFSYTRENGRQYNPTVGGLSNQDDIATEEINLRVRVVAEADAGAADFTANIGSLGALIRGNATEVDRPAPFVATDLGGTLGATFAGNDPILAIRTDPSLAEVVTQFLPFAVAPGGSDITEVSAVVVPESDTDASGFVTPIINNSQNTALQATTQVTSFPTTTKTDIKGNSVTAPDIDRVLATVVGQGGGKNKPSDTETPQSVQKRVFDTSPVTDSEVVLFLARQISGNDGGIDWLKLPTKQDW